ncbi:MAG: DUF389 domain-containing protein [Vicingaceae bacterium]|nr:MAG: DUF389 domain-containing protein [Vicingaceae bacterium]
MNLRLIEIILPGENATRIIDQLKNEEILDYWREEVFKDEVIIKVLLDANKTESLMDKLEKKFSNDKRFRMVSIEVKTTIPRPDDPENSTKQNIGRLRVSRDELYTSASNSVELNYVYFIMIVLSTVIAAIGLYKNSVALIIGSMVIAPLLSPNIAISLATVIGDYELEKKGFIAFFLGAGLSLVLSILLGLIFPLDLQFEEVKSRTSLNYPDLIVAIASGVAGTLAFTTGEMMGVVGVMVAIALLPPLVNAGMLLGNGHWLSSLGSFLLFTANFASLNLAGVLTFLLQGVRSGNWWEEKKARKHRKKVIILWIILILLLAIAIFWKINPK